MAMPGDRIRADICVIGAGSGGLTVAAGAARLGVPTVLIERGLMGGDCLNTGCVPSKSLLAAAKLAAAMRRAPAFGLGASEPRVDFARVHDHVHAVIAAIAPHDSVEHFTGLGVRVIRASARFTGPGTVEADGAVITARRFVLATGSRPAVPAIPGLDAVPFLTNETVFEQRSLPEHLVIIGGGPIGLELAQAHRRLGSLVTVLERFSILPKDDPELVDRLRRAVVGDGVTLHEGAEIKRVERAGDGVALVVAVGGAEQRIVGSHLLVAAGRSPNVEDLDLAAAGIAAGPHGVTTDARLRTTNRRVFAVGDVAGGPQFTHAAGYHAGVVLRNALFRLPARVDYAALPWVTFTEPELATVGLSEAAARARWGKVSVLRSPFAENDRAQAERAVEGLVKVVARPNGRVVGASIVGAAAGELIHLWVLAIAQRLKVGAIATMIAPYPTLGEASKRAAGTFYEPALFSARTRALVKALSWLG